MKYEPLISLVKSAVDWFIYGEKQEILVFINLKSKQQYNSFKDNEDNDKCKEETHSDVIKQIGKLK